VKHVLDDRDVDVELEDVAADVIGWSISEEIQLGMIRPQDGPIRSQPLEADRGVLEEILEWPLALHPANVLLAGGGSGCCRGGV
jgi:hypothetical protein